MPKSKRTRALDISQKVRKAVYERDSDDGISPLCIICKRGDMLSVAHYIPRSLSGLGIEQNLGVMCIPCHDKHDHGYPEERKSIDRLFRKYLQLRYPDWSEEQLRYKKD
ncbi:MAG: hypothetical protein FWC20_01860 [Oscillospiraceae bacterium]|nr:hypothetical protein [Oscillospiraceae bacterium]MCL2278138.1 hypothetical protein [Oscillospiraceae bacterium]